MEVIIQPDAEAVSKTAAAFFRKQISLKPTSVLGLATGSTPLGLYRELVRLGGLGEIDFSKVVTFNLDEYVGLSAFHPRSYGAYMRDNLFSKINIDPRRTHIPDGMVADVPTHCEEYEDAIRRAGGIDLQLLGIGGDGHIGFNEPSSSLRSRTRIKTLTPRTIADNARYFPSESEVPRHVITMGVGTIMEARRCLTIATGEAKALAVAMMVEGAITADCPASVMQMHPSCTLVIDELAASRLQRREYYRWVYENKPQWQQL